MPQSPRLQYEESTRATLRACETRLDEIHAAALVLSGDVRDGALRAVGEAENRLGAVRLCLRRLEYAGDGELSALQETMDSLVAQLRVKVADAAASVRAAQN